MGRILLVLATLVACHLSITADAQYVHTVCRDTDNAPGSPYGQNLNLVFSNLKTESSARRFFNSTEGVVPNKVFGLFQCRSDVSLEICSSCVEKATQKITAECPFSGEAIVWYNECMLRYANRTIFSLYETSPLVNRSNPTNVSNFDESDSILARTLNELIKNASSAKPPSASSKTNWTSVDQLYTFAQCTPDIDEFGCKNCLKTALSQMVQCCAHKTGVMLFLPSCQLRYNTSSFLYDQPPPALLPFSDQASKKTSLKPGIIAAIVISVSVVLLASFVLLWINLQRRKTKGGSSSAPLSSPKGLHNDSVNGDAEDFGEAGFVEYDFATLKTATRDFSPENVLGEGEFGTVYKGTLDNGRRLAIKRLSGTTGIDTNKFIAGVDLVAKLQHKNLVRLIGFCSDRDEKLLVSEYMSNPSLNRFLFDPKKRPLLDWVTRHKIIMGIARGLQYLHEDSQFAIIHRNLKPGKILLDKQMNPKIADFGMTKIFGGEQHGEASHIIGTQGYMAPEYLLTGEYSKKSDVYSFGIILLEIISGQKNRLFNRSPRNEDLAVHAWRLWIEGRSFDLTDSALYNNCSSNDVMKCIQIGLLCVQADAEQRPSMTSVVLMLTGSVDLQVPTAPSKSSNQLSTVDPYNGEQPSDPNQPSTKTVTWRAELDQDLYPGPR